MTRPRIRRSDLRNTTRRLPVLVVLVFGMSLALVGSAPAATPVPLGTASSYALLGGSTITNTGATTVTGDIGLATGTAITGFDGPDPDRVTQPGGARHITDGAAATAQDDLDVAYFNAAGQAVDNTVPVDLSLTGTPANPLLPGVYESTAHGAFQINTGLTLDFQGDPNAVFVFQGTTLTTAVGASGSVNIVNGGGAPSTCNVVWQLSDATQGVTLGAGSAFKGTTLALGASVLGTGATVEGRILTRRSKAVSLDTNTITRTSCFAAAPNGGGGGGSAPPADTAPRVDTPAPAPTPAPPAPAPADNPTAPSPPAPGAARISGPHGPVRGPFTVSVTGPGIAHVVFYVDGRRVGTVHGKPGRKKFKITVHPPKRGHKVHRVTGRVTYTTPGTGMTTVRLTYWRPFPRPRPHFAG
jgi:hypothetical protein